MMVQFMQIFTEFGAMKDQAPDGAEGVGKATTKSVVTSIIAIFMFNVVLSWILY